MVSRCVILQVFTLLLACSLVLQHFVVFAAASRPLKICTPGIRTSNNKSKVSRRHIKLDTIVEKIEDRSKKMASRKNEDFQGFVVNRYKKMEDAFRPTAPGHSPGIGHPP